MKKQLLFIQAGGFGDILFLESIARKYFLAGCVINWPVFEVYLDDLKRHIPYVNWMPWDQKYLDHDALNDEYYTIFPFHTSSSLYQDPSLLMKSKYMMAGEDFNNWRTLHFNRDMQKERDLIGVLGIDIKDDYNLLHYNYGTPGGGVYSNKSITRNIKNNELPTVLIKQVRGFSIIDWSTIIENANEINFVSTCTMYLAEILTLVNDPEMHLYPRHSDQCFSHTIGIHKKDWRLHRWET